jgi:hypothetical protein
MTWDKDVSLFASGSQGLSTVVSGAENGEFMNFLKKLFETMAWQETVQSSFV